MKIYVSGDDSEVFRKFGEFAITDKMEATDKVLILPGGLGTYYDLFRAIKENKKVYLYNKGFFYTPIIRNLYDLYLKGIIEKVPSEYIDIECELEKIIEKIKEK